MVPFVLARTFLFVGVFLQSQCLNDFVFKTCFLHHVCLTDMHILT
jgi:hypothetical protein